MNDTFVNSPWRDRAQWWTDARIVSRAAYYVFNDTKLLEQGLRQFADSQKPDGRIAAVYPSSTEQFVPDTSLFWVLSVLEHYAFTDDAEVAASCIRRSSDCWQWFASFECEDGLIGNVPGELFIDAADLDRRGESTALNCLYYGAMRAAGALAYIAGDEAEGQAWLETANRLKLAINKHLYSPPHGLYAECRVDGKLVKKFCRQTNVLAAMFDIPDHYQKSCIYRQVINGVMPGIPTPYFTYPSAAGALCGRPALRGAGCHPQEMGPDAQGGARNAVGVLRPGRHALPRMVHGADARPVGRVCRDKARYRLSSVLDYPALGRPGVGARLH